MNPQLAETTSTVGFQVSQESRRRGDPLRECVREALENYLDTLDGHAPKDLYDMVLNEVEHPLLETVLNYTGSNQTRAAQILGISRSTLRKKMALYNLE